MADWRRFFTVDLFGPPRLADALRPLATDGTATVCFASMAGTMNNGPDEAADAVLDDPLADAFLDRPHATLGSQVEDPGIAYSWAKLGVQRFVRQEAMRLGPVGARICSISLGIIDTPQGRQEAETHAVMQQLVEMSALGREGRSEELAAVAAFLLSDEASFLTGDRKSTRLNSSH